MTISVETVDEHVWTQLRAAAVAASTKAYVPYSRYPVGAAALTTRGRIVTGCNVENAAYGVVLCAECGVVSSLAVGDDRDEPACDVGAGRDLLLALSCVDASGAAITPCGRCRQLLWEHAAQDMLIDMPDGSPLGLAELLPHAFGVNNLRAIASASTTVKGES